MKKAKVSIIIPCYNNGCLLSKMIDCIVRQTDANWELIIVDDCSTDDTQETVRKYVEKDMRIRFFVRDREPKGSVTCRNIGFDKAQGKYVIHFDADDLISDTCLEKRVCFMEENPEIDYASFPAKMWYADNPNPPEYTDLGKTWGAGKDNTDLLASFLKADYPFSVWNNIYKRESIKDFRWDEKVKIYTDFSFIVPCILSGLKHKFSGLKEIDYLYRVGGNASNMCSNFVSDEKYKSTKYLLEKTLNQLQNIENYKYYKHCYFSFIKLVYKRLLVNGDKSKINDYITFCSNYYSKYTIIQMRFLKNFLICLKNNTIRRKMIHCIFFLCCGYKKYMNIVKLNILAKINKI